MKGFLLNPSPKLGCKEEYGLIYMSEAGNVQPAKHLLWSSLLASDARNLKLIWLKEECWHDWVQDHSPDSQHHVTLMPRLGTAESAGFFLHRIFCYQVPHTERVSRFVDNRRASSGNLLKHFSKHVGKRRQNITKPQLLEFYYGSTTDIGWILGLLRFSILHPKSAVQPLGLVGLRSMAAYLQDSETG